MADGDTSDDDDIDAASSSRSSSPDLPSLEASEQGHGSVINNIIPANTAVVTALQRHDSRSRASPVKLRFLGTGTSTTTASSTGGQVTDNSEAATSAPATADKRSSGADYEDGLSSSDGEAQVALCPRAPQQQDAKAATTTLASITSAMSALEQAHPRRAHETAHLILEESNRRTRERGRSPEQPHPHHLSPTTPATPSSPIASASTSRTIIPRSTISSVHLRASQEKAYDVKSTRRRSKSTGFQIGQQQNQQHSGTSLSPVDSARPPLPTSSSATSSPLPPLPRSSTTSALPSPSSRSPSASSSPRTIAYRASNTLGDASPGHATSNAHIGNTNTNNAATRRRPAALSSAPSRGETSSSSTTSPLTSTVASPHSAHSLSSPFIHRYRHHHQVASQTIQAQPRGPRVLRSPSSSPFLASGDSARDGGRMEYIGTPSPSPSPSPVPSSMTADALSTQVAALPLRRQKSRERNLLSQRSSPHLHSHSNTHAQRDTLPSGRRSASPSPSSSPASNIDNATVLLSPVPSSAASAVGYISAVSFPVPYGLALASTPSPRPEAALPAHLDANANANVNSRTDSTQEARGNGNLPSTTTSSSLESTQQQQSKPKELPSLAPASAPGNGNAVSTARPKSNTMGGKLGKQIAAASADEIRERELPLTPLPMPLPMPGSIPSSPVITRPPRDPRRAANASASETNSPKTSSNPSTVQAQADLQVQSNPSEVKHTSETSEEADSSYHASVPSRQDGHDLSENGDDDEIEDLEDDNDNDSAEEEVLAAFSAVPVHPETRFGTLRGDTSTSRLSSGSSDYDYSTSSIGDRSSASHHQLLRTPKGSNTSLGTVFASFRNEEHERSARSFHHLAGAGSGALGLSGDRSSSVLSNLSSASSEHGSARPESLASFPSLSRPGSSAQLHSLPKLQSTSTPRDRKNSEQPPTSAVQSDASPVDPGQDAVRKLMLSPMPSTSGGDTLAFGQATMRDDEGSYSDLENSLQAGAIGASTPRQPKKALPVTLSEATPKTERLSEPVAGNENRTLSRKTYASALPTRRQSVDNDQSIADVSAESVDQSTLAKQRGLPALPTLPRSATLPALPTYAERDVRSSRTPTSANFQGIIDALEEATPKVDPPRQILEESTNTHASQSASTSKDRESRRRLRGLTLTSTSERPLRTADTLRTSGSSSSPNSGSTIEKSTVPLAPGMEEPVPSRHPSSHTAKLRAYLENQPPWSVSQPLWYKASVIGKLPAHGIRAHSATLVPNDRSQASSTSSTGTSSWPDSSASTSAHTLDTDDLFALDPDGARPAGLYVFGGCDNRTCFRDLYKLDLVTFTWTKPRTRNHLAAPPALRAHSATYIPPFRSLGDSIYSEDARTSVARTSLDGHLIFFGGGDGPLYFNDLYLLNLTTMSWSKPSQPPLSPLPVSPLSQLKEDPTGRKSSVPSSPQHIFGSIPSPRRAHTAVWYERRKELVVFGGGNGKEALDETYVLECKDWKRLNWKKIDAKGSIPRIRGYHTMNLCGEKAIVYGGSDGNECFSDVYILDLRTFTWTQIPVYEPSMHCPRLSHSATLVSPTQLLILGGHNGTDYKTSVTVFSLATGRFTKVSGVTTLSNYSTIGPSRRGYHTASLHDGRIVFLGGYDGRHAFDEVWLLEASSIAAFDT